jgi:3D (Asp-Asp-Asp) domain-containing protein
VLRGTFARVRRPPPPWAPLAALLLLLAVTLSVASAGSAGRVAALRAEANSLSARRHAALLDLYAIQTQLTRTRERVAGIRAETARVRAERALVQRQVRITRRAYLVFRQQLGVHLRALYEQGNLDELSVLFGARSLDTALTNIDALDRLAAQSKSAVRQTTVTGRKLRRLTAQLDRHIVRLAVLEHEAVGATAQLEAARAKHVGLIATLTRKEQFSRQSIASLEATARAADVKSAHLTARAATDPPAPPPTTTAAAAATTTASAATASAPPPVPASGATTLTVVATGYSIHGRTATGVTTGWGVAAVDPSVIPLGTRFSVPGYGTAVAADVGSGVRGAMIDLWFPTVAAARAWGRKSVTITIRN